MEYAWKHGIQIVSNHTFETEDPLEKVGKILVDLCTGDKYKIQPGAIKWLAALLFGTSACIPAAPTAAALGARRGP